MLIPLKDKTGKSVPIALRSNFKDRKPDKMYVDKGKEFHKKDVKDSVELYSTENEEKSSVVERWIRTMKEKMWKYFPVTPHGFTLMCYKISLKNIITRDILLLR